MYSLVDDEVQPWDVNLKEVVESKALTELKGDMPFNCK